MLKIHHVKCAPEYFTPLAQGLKTAELRLNDRDYQVGDVLVVEEWTAEGGYTGSAVGFSITHILSGGPWLQYGYVMLSIDRVPWDMEND